MNKSVEIDVFGKIRSNICIRHGVNSVTITEFELIILKNAIGIEMF